MVGPGKNERYTVSYLRWMCTIQFGGLRSGSISGDVQPTSHKLKNAPIFSFKWSGSEREIVRLCCTI